MGRKRNMKAKNNQNLKHRRYNAKRMKKDDIHKVINCKSIKIYLLFIYTYKFVHFQWEISVKNTNLFLVMFIYLYLIYNIEFT